MADLDQGKLMMLAEEGVEVDCWKQGRLHWYYKWRTENTKLCWMMRTIAPIFLALVVLANFFLAALTVAAPTQQATTSSAPFYETSSVFTSIPTEEMEDEQVVQAQTPPSSFNPTAPRPLPFIKNVKCKLHKKDGRTVARRCGLRKLDLPDSESGVEFWNPGACRSTSCQCVATKEIRRREKRTIANNKTEIEYRRYRLFECV